MQETRNLYIVLTQTGTVFSRILKCIYKREYNHASISIDDSMEPMFSFGRLKPYNAFKGGFVKESVNWGTFKRFYKTTAKILCVKVDQRTFEGVSKTLENFWLNRKNCKYNYRGLFFGFFGKYKAFNNCFYCSEFIKEVLVKNGISGCEKLPDIIHPSDFTIIPHTVIYEGILREYKYEKNVEISV
ncbi:MAG: hypothetical protein E7568_05790 [Ruminococcaceae bacterium]|nr:hypothetical protein [Oscillospiraceae bacterium]